MVCRVSATACKQQCIHDTRILEGERPNRGRESKDHVAVGDVEQLPRTGSEPGGLGTAWACGAVPIPTRVRTALFMAPGIARRFMAPERGGAAVADGLQDPALGGRRHRAIAGHRRVAILPDDIRAFQEGAGHGCPCGAGPRGKVSSGLGIVASAWGVTCRERLVVRRL